MAERFDRIGCWISAKVAEFFAHPFAQAGLLVFCAWWLLRGQEVDTLTLALSIVAITLTQMVLNMQKSREAEAHRRDMALHAKLDELIVSMKGARDELAGVEEREEEEIEAIRHHAGSVEAIAERRARRGARPKVAARG